MHLGSNQAERVESCDELKAIREQKNSILTSPDVQITPFHTHLLVMLSTTHKQILQCLLFLNSTFVAEFLENIIHFPMKCPKIIYRSSSTTRRKLLILHLIIHQYKLILNLYESTVPISHVIVQYVFNCGSVDA